MLPKIDVLVLSSIAKRPMHGYEIKQELRLKHVRWWAKVEHGHLYASLKRLERNVHATVQTKAHGGRTRKVFHITDAGRQALDDALAAIATGPDQTWFDVDLFLSSSFLLPREEAIQLLQQRRETLRAQLAEAEALQARIAGRVPPSARLIVEHRIEHLQREVAYARRAEATFREQASWGSIMDGQSVDEFIQRTAAPLESSKP